MASDGIPLLYGLEIFLRRSCGLRSALDGGQRFSWVDGGRQRGGGGLLRLVNGIGRGSCVGRARRGGGEEIGRRRGSALLCGLLDARSSTCRHSPLPFHDGNKGEGEREREGVGEGEGKSEEKVEREGEGGRMTIARKPWPRTGLVWLWSVE